MQEFSSVTASSYDAEALAPLLTEKAAEGWAVISIVAAGTNIVHMQWTETIVDTRRYVANYRFEIEDGAGRVRTDTPQHDKGQRRRRCPSCRRVPGPRYLTWISTRRASASLPPPCVCSGFLSSMRSSGTPAAFSASAKAARSERNP